MKIALINNGCAKNLVDSELMLGLLADKNYKITLNPDEAEFVIVNTCSFILDAEKESISDILEMINNGKKVIITGCLPQKHKKKLLKLLPEAVAFLGTTNYLKIVEVINSLINNKNKQQIYEVEETPNYKYCETTKRQQITVGSASYLKISDGCNFKCGYCVIPRLRGDYSSRPIENIVKEAKDLVEKGVNEIVLIAQDTTSYGIDIYKKPSLARLLKELNKIENLDWIRIMYTYPSLIDDELIDTIANCDKVVKYLDMPLQHSHKFMLKEMLRPVVDYEVLINKIRARIPDITLRTTFIVGYPGETQEHFEHLKYFIEKMRFDRVGIFEYCKEKNTHAYSLPNQIHYRTKQKRKNILMKLQQQISLDINKTFIGKTIPAIVEAINPDGSVVARTFRDAPEVDGLVYITTQENLQPTDIVQVLIKNVDEYDLWGIV